MIRKLLEEKEQEWRKILAKQSPKAIDSALKALEESREWVKNHKGINSKLELATLEEETRSVFELMEQFKQEIKQIFMENGVSITHITGVSPENMLEGKIKRSCNRANNYETERGDWVFASSNPMDGRNPYIARNPNGMIRIAQNAYIYGGDNMQIQTDEQGNSHVVLKNPNYVYEISPQNFTPVVILEKDREGKPYFAFSEEWVSEQDVDLENAEQVKGPPQVISDITELIRNYQILCDVHMTGEGWKIRSCSNLREAIESVREAIRSGRLRYMNGEAGINVSEMIENEELVTSIGKATLDVGIQMKDDSRRRIKREIGSKLEKSVDEK